MKWEKVGKRRWEAIGNVGRFIIEQSGKLFWARYINNIGTRTFKLKPTQKLKEAKELCQDNYYWEGIA
jgi:hypothetical protein